MIRPVCRDSFLLAMKSTDATVNDLQAAADLADTLRANADRCVGMAANMIGIRKRIIAFFDNGVVTVWLNPEIIHRDGEYEVEEGCLSLDGQRKATRYQTIRVRAQDQRMKWHTVTYTGWTAQIVQHEVDHCMGILI